jgi:hypothetical protein
VIIYVEQFPSGVRDYTDSDGGPLATIYDEFLGNIFESKMLDRGFLIKDMPEREAHEG